jgi:hypothetical protein
VSAEGTEELLQAQQRLAKLERIEKNLQRLVMEEAISFEDFKEHRASIDSERANLKTLVDAISSRQGLVRADFEIALQLASQLDFLFAKGDYDERRLLCETIFKRLRVRDRKIVQVELNSPFTLIASRGEGSESFLNGEPIFPETVMYFVYVLQNPQGRIYIGFTTHLEKRIQQHQQGEAGWTRARGPWKLAQLPQFHS